MLSINGSGSFHQVDVFRSRYAQMLPVFGLTRPPGSVWIHSQLYCAICLNSSHESLSRHDERLLCYRRTEAHVGGEGAVFNVTNQFRLNSWKVDKVRQMKTESLPGVNLNRVDP